MEKVLVTGSSGMLGRNFSEILRDSRYKLIEHTRSDVDLIDSRATKNYFQSIEPTIVIHCAALVGGIQANVLGGQSYYSVNKTIDENVLSTCQSLKVRKLIYISSSCMYPASTNRLLRIEDLGIEPLEPTNRAYALAKIWATRKVEEIAKKTGLVWRAIVSSNLYGPFDHFDTSKGHLLASTIEKVVRANKLNLRSVEMWGDGTPRREFTYAPELAEWVISKIEQLDTLPFVLNVGFGQDYTVRDYYEMVISRINPLIEIISRPELPNGNMNKLMDSSHARALGWNPEVSPELGISKTLDWYLSHIVS